MRCSSDIRWKCSALAVCLLLAFPLFAQTNEADTGESAQFFTKYKQTVELLGKGKTQDAGIAMDLLARNLTTSPWMEIALLKHAQLVELTNDRVAEENLKVLRQRLTNAPYFQAAAGNVKAFTSALQGAVDNGVNRLRLRRVREAIGRYHGRYGEYPESLAKLSILGYTDMENIRAVNNQLFRYVPQMPRINPFISYQRYDLETIDPDPFLATHPKLEGVSQLSEKPLKYTALIRVPGNDDPARINEDQTVLGYFVVAIGHDGAIVATPKRILVLLAP